MSVSEGEQIELTVTPDAYVTVRYAGASGDFNPIHVDAEFAKQVGLPDRILHGLWTMAQVARAQTHHGDGALGPLRRLGPLGRCATPSCFKPIPPITIRR